MAKLGEFGDKLERMTEQEVFDVGAEHLLTQMKKSLMHVIDTSCAYNGTDDLCCAAAPFIRNYDEKMEGNGWYDLTAVYEQSSNCASLISCLQNTHDEYEPSDWKSELATMGRIFELNTDVLDKF